MEIQPLYIDETFDTPVVILDYVKKQLLFSGKSMPENPKEFYNPIIEWVDKYIKTPLSETHVIFKLEYFNTVSSRRIMEILEKFHVLHETGKNVIIDWYYEKDDLDMKKAGDEFSMIVGIPINTIMK